MPNAKVLSEKQAIVAELTEKIQKASAGVLVDYKGITVEEDTALRRECRENGVDYAVVKNTLLRFAFNNTGLNELDGLLNGTTSLALCDSDVVAPARVMSDYAKKLNDRFEIKGGFMDGKPGKPELLFRFWESDQFWPIHCIFLPHHYFLLHWEIYFSILPAHYPSEKAWLRFLTFQRHYSGRQTQLYLTRKYPTFHIVL